MASDGTSLGKDDRRNPSGDDSLARSYPSRRTFVKSAAVTGVLAAGGTTVLASNGSDDSATDIFLEAEIGGWEGEEPEGIDGETNPPLRLEAGQEYTLVWENEDGFRHNFVIIDANGDEVVRSPVMDEQGATQ